MNQSHQNSKEIFNLRMNPDLNLGGQWEHQLHTYQVGTGQFDIYLPYNLALINHYKTYPILPLADYVNNDIHNVIKYSIVDQLSDYLDVENEQNTINFLLVFVQTLLQNNEHLEPSPPMLVQQSIVLKSASTYEKILLFKALIGEVLDNYMMVVEYEKHLTLGIKLKSKHEFKTFRVNLGDYVLLDPSYVNGVIGNKMPIENSPFIQWHPLY